MKPVTSLPILLVDDDPQLLHSVSVALRSAGFPQVITLEDARGLPALLEDQAIGAVLLDLTMPQVSGRALLDQIASDHPEVPIIVLTATNDLATAVECMQAGAVDYLVKPVEQGRLASSLRRALDTRALEAELVSLKTRVLEETPHEDTAFAEIVTQDRSMTAIFRYIEAIAPSPQPVLITGETGTGKELVARALHRLSRRPGELVTVNSAGLDDTVFADTLFGHTRGAFTGADRAREGLIGVAGEGTLFLDEIGDLSISSQLKLLRLLQDGGYYQLGADRPHQSRARFVVATNRDVSAAVASGTFRKDLYYRLRTHHFELPPLRARQGDLPLLVAHFIDRAAASLGKARPAVPPPLYTLLRSHIFPGNIRELEAMVFDAVTRAQGPVLSLQSFKDAIGAGSQIASETPDGDSPLPMGISRDRLPTLHEAEETLIDEALQRAEGNQGIAAGLLGLSRQALNKRLVRRKHSDRR
jgi:two-component system, NtrC family, nitrogen regulation response regulator GlnG